VSRQTHCQTGTADYYIWLFSNLGQH